MELLLSHHEPHRFLFDYDSYQGLFADSGNEQLKSGRRQLWPHIR